MWSTLGHVGVSFNMADWCSDLYGVFNFLGDICVSSRNIRLIFYTHCAYVWLPFLYCVQLLSGTASRRGVLPLNCRISLHFSTNHKLVVEKLTKTKNKMRQKNLYFRFDPFISSSPSKFQEYHSWSWEFSTVSFDEFSVVGTILSHFDTCLVMSGT